MTWRKHGSSRCWEETTCDSGLFEGVQKGTNKDECFNGA